MNNSIDEHLILPAVPAPRILIAPLDWGLGHATRCVPIIYALLAKGCPVLIASSGPQETLLRAEFPQLTYLQLNGYAVAYSKKRLMIRLATQLFKLKNAIKAEHRWLEQIIAIHKIDWVISDNRYGLWSENIPCTFITHQLHVQMPPVFKWTENLIQVQLYDHIAHFSACWVPDLPDEDRGLSGQLGHPVKKPNIPNWYLGWLSRFNLQEEQLTFPSKCLIILSGPEPQRTLLENILLKQLVHSKEKIILLRGLPNEKSLPSLPPNIVVYNHLPAPQMQQAFKQCEYLVSRSGYSTLMDAYTLQKKCIFIPTPGQTEQEYLGKRLAEKKMALVYKQDHFNLVTALKEAGSFDFHFPLNSTNNLLEMAVDNFMATYLKKTP
ncbi:glycosyltransferase [soil metagenome]